MRVLLLITLAGGLGYLAYSILQGASPEVTSAETAFWEPTSPGKMLSPGGPPPESGAAADESGAANDVEVGVGAGARPGAPAPASVAADPQALAELASLLLQYPAEVEGWLVADGEQRVGAARARLVRAFGLALAGRGPKAIEVAQGLNRVQGVTGAELALLGAAVTGKGGGVRAASTGRNVLASSMGVALAVHRARRSADQGDARGAAESWSEVLLAGTQMPWNTDPAVLETWLAGLNGAQAQHRLNPRGEWPSVDITVEPGDNLTFVRRRLLAANPGLLICTGLLEQVNHLGRYIQPGDVLRAPTERARVLVDLSERVLLYLHGDEVVAAWTVGIGKPGEETPTGQFEIGEKEREPSWFPKGGAMVPYGHADNPLGTRWLAWYEAGRKTGYGIHGTNDPRGVGGRVSRGCIRMHNGGVELLYDILPLHASIEVRP